MFFLTLETMPLGAFSQVYVNSLVFLLKLQSCRSAPAISMKIKDNF